MIRYFVFTVVSQSRYVDQFVSFRFKLLFSFQFNIIFCEPRMGFLSSVKKKTFESENF
jgi:hypothetical protein